MTVMQETSRAAPAALSPQLCRALESIYSDVDRQIVSLGVGCWMHGECCDFERKEHRLYASSLEVAYARQARPAAGPPQGRLCPFWQGGRCTAHEGRPLGCRTYFCDPRYRESLEDLYEKHYQRIRRLAVEHQYPWRYGLFVAALRAAALSP